MRDARSETEVDSEERSFMGGAGFEGVMKGKGKGGRTEFLRLEGSVVVTTYIPRYIHTYATGVRFVTGSGLGRCYVQD